MLHFLMALPKTKHWSLFHFCEVHYYILSNEIYVTGANLDKENNWEIRW